jgi:hypothetical protein
MLESPRAVFEAVGTRLGKLVKRIPDGETGSSLFAAYALARRLRSDERFVAVQIPTEVGADWAAKSRFLGNRDAVGGDSAPMGYFRN